jgi:glycopeptide antibiotics resistance protein
MLIVIFLGLGSRLYANYLPTFIATYAGDTLWALQVFLAVGFLFPTFSTLKVARIALAFAFFIEITQLYHAPWLDNIRHYRLAALVLGYGFLWSDLVCYTVGVMLGVMAERIGKRLRSMA